MYRTIDYTNTFLDKGSAEIAMKKEIYDLAVRQAKVREKIFIFLNKDEQEEYLDKIRSRFTIKEFLE